VPRASLLLTFKTANQTSSTVTQKPRRKTLSLAQRQALWAYVFLLVPLAFFLLVRLYPAFSSLLLSLRDYRPSREVNPFVGLKNFQDIASDAVFWRAMLNTLLYTVIGVPAQLVLGILVALMLQGINKAKGLFRAIYFMPYVTPIVASAWVWQSFLNQNFGPVNQLLSLLGLPNQPFFASPYQALPSVAAFVVWQQLGFQIVLFLAGLEAIPRTYLEAASLDGASGWQMFRYIKLPLLNPTIVFSVVIGTTGFLQLFAQVVNINFGDQGGPLNSTLTVAVYIYKVAFQDFKMGRASAITVVLFAIILLITIFQLRVLRKRVDY
jgi:multiple sugar transport system permease protein